MAASSWRSTLVFSAGGALIGEIGLFLAGGALIGKIGIFLTVVLFGA